MCRNRERSVAICMAVVATLIWTSTVHATGAAGVVNINTASAEQLALLPRVGPAVASRIVEFREQNGSFKDKSDLLLVRGIGDKTYDLIEPYVTINGDTSLKEKVKVERGGGSSGRG